MTASGLRAGGALPVNGVTGRPAGPGPMVLLKAVALTRESRVPPEPDPGPDRHPVH